MKKQQKKKGKKGKKSTAASTEAQDSETIEKEEVKEEVKEDPKEETKKDETETPADDKPTETEKEETKPKETEKVTESVKSLSIEDNSELKQELDAANKKVKDLEEQLAKAVQSISELEKRKEESTAKTASEYEEGPGPQIGGEASEDTGFPNLEVDTLKQKIESLNVENEYLTDKVYTLEAKVANLININKRVSVDRPRDESPGFDSDASLASPLPSIKDNISNSGSRGNHRPRVSSLADMDLYGEAARLPEIEKEMERWKGWQVDMRGWRSQGVGPVFEI